MVYIGAAISSLLIWPTAEGLGRTLRVASDIGVARTDTVDFLALLALDSQGKATRSYSLDAVMERPLPWWRGLAEIRR